ncbi:hypothetical protein QP535_00065 [Lactobacillus crispatus]|jgi:hypothetical protein|uniref:hypothetical protein n=1 Tax=Lactobacillus crispatus TaxID=47770 RepID=UPI0018E38759|nr:hypothetical protein [Lactobacillus crispatus]MBI1701752.1 enoyl-CoA hydratase [Lactobacillus crispatus]MDK7582102.1 hypothetical protein [Lactobacillus crispatus]
MLDHMIFDRLKWFNISDNTDSVTANGKNWKAIPKQVVLPQGAKIATFSGDGSALATDAIIMLNSDTTANVIGKIADCYAVTGVFNGTGQNTENNATLNLSFDEEYIFDDHRYEVNFVSFGLIRESEVKSINWGGKNLLHTVVSVVKRAFTLFKKGAETC